MKRVDIEVLLQWAYRDELSKRATSAAEGVWDHAGEFALTGIVGDGCSAGPQRYAVVGTPHPDALALEKLVRALPDVTIEWAVSRRALMGDLDGFYGEWIDWHGSPRESRASVAWFRHLRGSPADPFLGQPAFRQSEIVRTCAVLKKRPLCCADGPRLAPLENGYGGHSVCYVEDDGSLMLGRKAKHYGPQARSPVVWYPTPVEIARERGEYAAWHAALTALAHTAAETGALRDHAAMCPTAPAEPWNTGPGAAAKVLQSRLKVAVAEPVAKVTAGPRRRQKPATAVRYGAVNVDNRC